MKRLLISLLSIVLAYVTCVVSGVNEWMYVWLKSFYVSYSISMWGFFAVLFVLYGMRAHVHHRRWVLIGPAIGYLAGLLAYQTGPAIRDGSFARSSATIATQGIATYAGTSALYPLLCLAPVVGLIGAAMFTMLNRSNDRYAAAGVIGVVLLLGWSFFLSHGAVPARW